MIEADNCDLQLDKGDGKSFQTDTRYLNMLTTIMNSGEQVCPVLTV